MTLPIKFEFKKLLSSKIKNYFLPIFIALIFSYNLSNAQGLNKGDIAPDFTVTDMNGVQHHLYDYLNDGKYVVLKFGHVGCGSCEAARPAFNNAYRNYGCNTKDIIFLEFDNGFTDADVVPQFWINAGFASENGDMPSTDIDYVFPEADYITTDGGSEAVFTLYEIQWVTHEFIIEPFNKTILGAADYPNGDEDAWTQAFSMMVAEGGTVGTGTLPGYTLLQTLQDEIPNAFHYVLEENLGEFLDNYNPLYYVPLNGTSPGETPFTMFCENSLTGCDTLKPAIIKYDVAPDSDTTYQVEVTWASDTDCPEIIVKYGIKGGYHTTQELTTTNNTFTVHGLYSGLYRFQLRCSCNNVVAYETADIVVGAETDFTVGTSCNESCEYKLILHNIVSEANTAALEGNNPWEDVRVRIQSENTTEFYTLHANVRDSVGGIWAEAMTYNLKFCKNSDINIKYIEPGFVIPGYVDDLHYAGFKFLDDEDNIVTEQMGSYVDNSGISHDVPTPAGHPGYFTYPTITACVITTIGNEENITNSVKIFPNPSKEYVIMEFENSIEIKNQTLYAVDITGRRLNITFKQLNANKYKIDLSNLPEGVYYFVINGINSVRIGRPIIKL